MNIREVKAWGPWVLVEIARPSREDGLVKSAGGLFLPDGNSLERMGLSYGPIVSVGQGIFDEKKRRYETFGLRVGDVIVFRGFLEVVNRPAFQMDDHCFLHMKDILGRALDDHGNEVRLGMSPVGQVHAYDQGELRSVLRI